MIRSVVLLVAILARMVPALAAQPAKPPAPQWPDSVKPGDWQLPGRDYAQTRFSPLDQITATNVVGLKPVWTFSTGQLHAHQGAPLVVGGTMYVHTPFPNAVYALDLTRPGAPELWSYLMPAAAARLTPPTGCCDVGSRGLAYHPSGKIFVPLLSGDLAALDAKTGREIWRVKNSDGRLGATMPAAPAVIKDLVIVGTAGAEYGVRGTMTAYDANTGRLVWRAYHTGPDADVMIEGEANSLYPSHRGRDLGVSTWSGDQWNRGGATASGWITYDPELDLIYYGTDHPGPLNASLRPGDNKWAATIFARAASTGKVRWALQLTPHDQWGYDASNEDILADLSIGGAPVKALVHFSRSGFAYTIDRTNGRIMLAERYGPANWASRVDVSTAQPVGDPRYAQGPAKTVGVCPAATGTKGPEPAAFSPVTSLFYVPTGNLCMDLQPAPTTFVPGKPFAGVTVTMRASQDVNRGRFIAWDATTGAIAWQVQEPFPVTSGALVTGGGVVFYGTMDGWLKAVDHKSGLELWRFKTPSGIVGNPMTFLDPAGKQYIAVLSGLGGWLGLGANGAYPNPNAISNQGGVLLVFGL